MLLRIAACIGLCLCAGKMPAASGNSVTTTRNGVAFTFIFNCDGGPCTHGRFIKGEPWVIPNSPTGTVTITAITELLRLYDKPDISPISVSPNPSSGYIRTAGPEKEYMVYDNQGRLVETVESVIYLDGGVYLVANAARTAMQQVVVMER